MAWNTGVGLIAQILITSTALLTTPVILNALGDSKFGAYALIASLTSYFGILDLGIGGSLARYMTYYSERHLPREVGAITTFGLLFYVLFAIVLLPIVTVASEPATMLLGLEKGVVSRPDMLILYVFGLFIFSSISGVVSARLTSIHRLDIASINNAIATVVFAICVVLLAPRYPAVETIILCVAIQLFTTSALNLAAVLKLCRFHLLINPLTIPRARVRELFTFGLWSQISSLCSLINLEADKAIISSQLGVSQVAPYQVANRLALLSRTLPLQMLGALLPDITARVSRNSPAEEIANVYRRGSRMLMLFTLLICGFVGGAASAVLLLWLSRPLPWAAEICIALLASYAVNNSTGLGTTILRAEGRPKVETAYAILSAGINIVVTMVLITPFGLGGVVAGTIVGNVLGSVFFLLIFHLTTRIPWWRTMGSWLWKLVAATLASSGTVHLFLAIVTSENSSRTALLLDIVVAGGSYVAVFGAILWLTGFWEEEDKVLFSRLAGRFRKGAA